MIDRVACSVTADRRKEQRKAAMKSIKENEGAIGSSAHKNLSKRKEDT